MSRIRSTAVATLAALTLVTTSALAAATTYEFDAAHTRAAFKVKHIFTNVPGYFKEVSGSIQFDQENLENSSVEATINAASIFTDHEKRDGHLKSEDFFFVEKYPTITFTSKKIVPGEGDAFQIIGDLTMRGVTKEVTLDATLTGAVDLGEMMGRRAGFTATTKINRKDYGINWSKTLDNGGLIVGNDVTIELDIEAVADSEAVSAKQ
jgi:polyisoprenoid-binding protein YceI